MRAVHPRSLTRSFAQRLLSVLGASGLTLACFLLLPLIQAITRDERPDTLLQSVDAGALEPPPPLAEEEPPEPEPEQAEEPPELQEAPQAMDLAQLELALDASLGGGWGVGSLGINLGDFSAAASAESFAASFADAGLDEPPRATFQKMPSMTAEMLARGPATVFVVFEVDTSGRVRDPRVLRSDDPLFDQAALDAVKKWRYEPGKRNGKPDVFRVKQPITFPKR